jgi:hypothetical protein
MVSPITHDSSWEAKTDHLFRSQKFSIFPKNSSTAICTIKGNKSRTIPELTPLPIQHKPTMDRQSTTIMNLPLLLPNYVVRTSADEDTTTKRKGARLLSQDFQPTPSSVIIGRSKTCKEAVGNLRLRILAEICLPKYSGATCKVDKSMVVTDLVKAVRTCCGGPTGRGAFIKYHNHRWWEVDNAGAREKVGYMLRDLLADRYKSSSRSKAARRNKEELIRRRKRANSGSSRSTCTTSEEVESEGDSAVAESEIDGSHNKTECNTQYCHREEASRTTSMRASSTIPNEKLDDTNHFSDFPSDCQYVDAFDRTCPTLQDDDDAQFDLKDLLTAPLIDY